MDAMFADKLLLLTAVQHCRQLAYCCTNGIAKIRNVEPQLLCSSDVACDCGHQVGGGEMPELTKRIESGERELYCLLADLVRKQTTTRENDYRVDEIPDLRTVVEEIEHFKRASV